MKKAALALTVILALLMSVAVGTQVVMPANANFGNMVEIPPPSGAEPPTISIFSPEDKVYTARELPLVFNVGEGTYLAPPEQIISGRPRVYCKADWNQNETFVAYGSGSYSINLTSVPNGVHYVSVRVTQTFLYDNRSGVVYSFNTENQSAVRFTVDSTAPLVTILLENKTYVTADVPLRFVVNEWVSLSYVLDGKENVTIDGNVTLTGLSDGEHNVTVYVQDGAGNIGASETINFTIAQETKPETQQSEPLSTTAIAASTLVAVIIGVSLAVYLTKARRTNQKPRNNQSAIQNAQD